MHYFRIKNFKTVADRHGDLLRIITSSAYDLSGATNIDDLERPCYRKIAGFSEFFAILCCDAFKSKFAPNLLQIDQDNLRMKLN